MTGRLESLVAIVTGAASGHGRAIATTFAREGAAVVCADITREPRAGGYDSDPDLPTDALIVKNGGRAVFVETNVSKSDQVQRAIATAVDTFGRLDLMINNAGVFTTLKSIVDETEEDFDFTMGVNGKGTWLCCKYAITQMLKQEPGPNGQRGRIVNLSSIGGLVGLRNESAYCASKGAVANLTRALALDFGKQKISVNALAPGLVATAMARPFLEDPAVRETIEGNTPHYRIGNAMDIANATLFLSSMEAEWITGAILSVDGGFVAQ